MTLFDVAVIGLGEHAAELLRSASFNAITIPTVSQSDFDAQNHIWTLHANDETFRARVVIERPGRLVAPWVPELPDPNAFGATTFHSADWAAERAAGFDPAGRRIGVFGAGAGALIPELALSAAVVTIFAPAPDWTITPWRPFLRRLRPRKSPEPLPDNVEVIEAGLEAGIEAGIAALTDHTVDALILATGYTLVGQTETQRGVQPFLGVAMHGLPNYFVLTGRGAGTEEQLQYLVECLKLMARRRGTRIEVRRSTQTVFNDRLATKVDSTVWRPRRPTRAAFDVSSSIAVEDEVYDGPATLRTGDDTHDVRVRLTGHLDPIDGRYHWQGLILDALPGDLLGRSRDVALSVGARTADARIAERTPWGSYSVVGVGAPPFALDDVEVAVPVP